MDSNICQESTIMQSLLPVPALDAQRDKILTKVCQEGGFAYVPLVMRAATGDVHAAEAAHDMAWEQLHSAPWHSVEPVWRDAYSLSCLHMASSHHRAGKFKEALRVLDMGLIMGGLLLRPDLNSAISLLQSTQTSMVNNCEGTKGVFIDAEIGNASIQGTDKIEENEDKGNLSNCLRQCYVPGGPVPHKCIGLWSKQGAASSKEQPPYQGKKEVPNLDVLDQQESRNKMPAEFCLSEVLQGLPRRSFCSKLIENWPMLSLEDFLCRFFLPGAPVIITGAMSHWPALTKWKDMEYLKTAVGNRTVPVEVGKNYLADGWKQELITMSQLLERIQSNESSPNTLTYLAQHPLFDQISQLREDIFIPDYCTASDGELHSVNAWLGPTGTVTPLHNDPHHNLLAQVVGRKYVRLYAASVSEDLYPYSETMLSNSSQIKLTSCRHHTEAVVVTVQKIKSSLQRFSKFRPIEHVTQGYKAIAYGCAHFLAGLNRAHYSAHLRAIQRTCIAMRISMSEL